MKNSIWRGYEGDWGYSQVPGKLAPYVLVESVLRAIQIEYEPLTRKVREDDFIVIPGELM